MSISQIPLDSQHLSTLDADLDHLAQQMNRLHEAAYLVSNDDERQHFAQLEQTVNWRLNAIASVLAAQDGHGSMSPQ